MVWKILDDIAIDQEDPSYFAASKKVSNLDQHYDILFE